MARIVGSWFIKWPTRGEFKGALSSRSASSVLIFHPLPSALGIFSFRLASWPEEWSISSIDGAESSTGHQVTRVSVFCLVSTCGFVNSEQGIALVG